jgi:hypothetical protein
LQLIVTSNFQVKLIEPHDFKRFDAVFDVPVLQLEQVRAALFGIAELEDDKAVWVNGDWLLRAGGPEDEPWREGFQKMTAYAQTKNWVRTSPLQIRAHCIWSHPCPIPIGP